MCMLVLHTLGLDVIERLVCFFMDCKLLLVLRYENPQAWLRRVASMREQGHDACCYR